MSRLCPIKRLLRQLGDERLPRFTREDNEQSKLDVLSGLAGRYLFGDLARLIVGKWHLLHTTRESTDALACPREAAATRAARDLRHVPKQYLKEMGDFRVIGLSMASCTLFWSRHHTLKPAALLLVFDAN